MTLLLLIPDFDVFLLEFSSSVLRSRPGQAHTRTSKQRRPKTCPLMSSSEQTPVVNIQGQIRDGVDEISMTGQSGTHSCVSSVIMVSIGRRFMPPMQLLLHIKFSKTVVPSEPSCREKEEQKWWYWEQMFYLCAGYKISLHELWTMTES